VEINPGDVLKGGTQEKPVWFRLPPGVEVKKVNHQPVSRTQPVKVEVTFTKRPEGE